MMKSLINIIISLSLVLSAAPAIANEAIEGMYISSIETAGSKEAVTSFKVTSSGKVFGIYFYGNQNGRKTQGKLNKCKLNGRVLQCRWNDRYGKGDWRVTFSKDYKRFNGKWYEKVGDLKRLGSKGGFKWSGEQIFQ